MNWTVRNLVCCIVGAFLVVIGLLQSILILSFGGKVLDSIVRNGIILGPNSPAYPLWKDIPIPLTTKIYLFNVTNPEEFAKGGGIPEVKEIGPFVYDEYHSKVKISWNKENETVTYQQIRNFFVNAHQSEKELDKEVTILNAIAATLSAMVKPMSSFERDVVNMGVQSLNEKLFVTSTPRKINFDGYTDPLLDAAKAMAKIGIHFPGEMDKFAAFYGRNGTDWFDGVFNMYTGKDDVSKANKLARWNYTDHTSFFPGRCGEVRGNAEMFTPFATDDTVELYSNDLCRPITLQFSENVHVKGVDGRRYEITPSYFANKTLNPDNWCYEGNHEVPSGVFNASSCRFNAPIFISQPHFFQADPIFASKFKNGSFSPSRDKHSTYFTINTVAGVPIEVVARFQVNLYIEKIPELTMFENLKEPIFFPAFWFESTMSLESSMAAKLWFLSNLVYVVLVIGLVVAVGGIICVARSYIRSKNVDRPNGVVNNMDEVDVGDGSSNTLLVNTDVPE